MRRAAASPPRRARSCGAASIPRRWRSASSRCITRRSSRDPKMRKGWWWSAQVAVAAVVALMVWRAVAKNWTEFRSLHVTLAPKAGWLALSVLAVFVTYAIQIESWRRILAGWAQRLGYGRAARIWLLVNLGRYVPGKVWSVAGLVVLAQRAGVESWAAGASAFAIQAIGLGSAVAVVAAATPSTAPPLRLVAAGIVAVATIALLAWERGARALSDLVGRGGEGRQAGQGGQFRPLPLAAVAESAGLTVLSWLSYGVAFWLLARGLGLPGALP